MAKRMSIKDVAQRAGVSYQTVSRVINNKPDVSSETRSRVQAAIDSLNYRPSLAAQVFAHERTMIIGVVIPWSADFLSDNHHLLQLLTGADREANLHDYMVLLSAARSKNDAQSSYERLLRRHIMDGVIVEGGMGQVGAKMLADKGYPVVMVGYSTIGIPSVHSDEDGGRYSGTQHLLALGHRRIGMISGPQDLFEVRNPFLGCLQALQHAGVSADGNLMIHSDFTVEGGYQAVQRLMQQPDPPTAIFAANDATALGVIRWLQEHEYRIPEDISVVGFDDMPSAQYFHPPLTTIHQFSSDIGQRAVSLLFDLIENSEPPTTEVIVPTQLVVRGSTAIAPGTR